MRTRTSLFVAVVTGALVLASRDFSAPAELRSYSIPVQRGASEFAHGDDIQITSVTGDRPHLEGGGNYQVQGNYSLSSADTATLFLSVTAKKLPASYPLLPGEMTTVNHGSGSFTLTMNVPYDGWPHVSFYIDRCEHGCIYFGEQGVESTVLRVKHWSAFSRVDGPTAKETSATGAPAEYLGNAVPPPSDLDLRYSPTGIMKAFRQLAAQSNWDLKKVLVDDTEFPHLVYGVIGGRHSWEEMKSAIADLPGYAYAGSCTSTSTDYEGMSFAVNLTPSEAYPRDRREAITRRLMTRLQMLRNRVQRELAESRGAEGGSPYTSESTYNAAGSRRMPGH